MQNVLKICIPEFIEEVQLAKARRKLYFSEGDKLPLKYQDSRYIYRRHGRSKDLFDTVEKEFVVKNPISAGTPNIMRISGNEIYARMHERKRMAIIEAIKNDMRPHLPESIPLKFPIHIDMDLYTTPKYCNWDVDNLWIYNKCFQDLLEDEGLIPNDNVLYITKPAAPRFIPVVDDSERKMIFYLYEDKDPHVVNHVMFSLGKKKEFSYLMKGDENTFPDRFYQIKRGTAGKLGDLIIDTYSRTFFVQMGKKKVVYGGLIKGLGRVYSQCIQLNCHPYVTESFFKEYKDNLKKELCDKGIAVYILKEGS